MNTAGSKKTKCWDLALHRPVSARRDRSQRSHCGGVQALLGSRDTGGDPGDDPAPFAIISVISICYNAFRSNFRGADAVRDAVGRER